MSNADARLEPDTLNPERPNIVNMEGQRFAYHYTGEWSWRDDPRDAWAFKDEKEAMEAAELFGLRIIPKTN